MTITQSKHCRRWRCRHVVGCLCNCKACAKLRPKEELAESKRSWAIYNSKDGKATQ